MTFEHLRLLLNQWVIANLIYMQFELPEKALAVLLDISPNLFEDAVQLADKLRDAQPDKTIKLNDTAIYTLYLGYDLLGCLLASSYRDKVLNAFREDGVETISAATKEKLYRHALINIAPVMKDSDTYARQQRCLKQLPDIKRKLKAMPVFD